MNKNVVYAILIIGGLAAIYFYAWPKYKEATGANIQPVQTAPGAAGGSRGDGY